MRRRAWAAPVLAVFVHAALAGEQVKPQAPAPPLFTDITRQAGITFVHASGASPEKHILETLGSGVAWIDYDNDGFQDLYFVNGATGAANVLYRNNGNRTFTDVTAKAGVGRADARQTGVAVGDYNNDGHLDLYVTAFGPNLLYRNNGNGTFTDMTTAAGVAGGAREWSTSTGFFDFDHDGDLDLYVVNYLDYDVTDNPYCGLQKPGYRMYCGPALFDGAPDRLFRNNGNGTFTDVSAAAGIANPAGKGLGLAFCDFDDDSWVDVYVANDMVRNFLYRNNGDGTFRDVTYRAGVGFDPNGKPQAGMGVDCADVDGNAQPDIFVTNFEDELNSLYLNQGTGVFEDGSAQPALATAFTPLGFGTRLFDLDNDTDLDIYVANGHVIDNIALYRASTHAQKGQVYENLGSGRFRDISAASGPALALERVGRGLAVADFDNDGRLDVAVSNLGQAPLLLRNTRPGTGHWLTIRAKGTRSNRFGLGARVRVQTAGQTHVREINNVASYLSAQDVRLHIGLGQATTADLIEVRWPSGTTQTLRNVAADQILTIEEP